MSLPCCFTDDEIPYCANRRHERSPMCLWHTKETLRRAMIDGSLPADVRLEVIRDTQWERLAERARAEHEIGTDLVRRHYEQRRITRERDAEQHIVYYVRLTGDRIKIGWTANLEQRLRAFRARAADVLAVEFGGQPVEAKRHGQFAHLRIGRTEEFREAPELLAHIESLRAAA